MLEGNGRAGAVSGAAGVGEHTNITVGRDLAEVAGSQIGGVLEQRRERFGSGFRTNHAGRDADAITRLDQDIVLGLVAPLLVLIVESAHEWTEAAIGFVLHI